MYTSFINMLNFSNLEVCVLNSAVLDNTNKQGLVLNRMRDSWVFFSFCFVLVLTCYPLFEIT